MTQKLYTYVLTAYPNVSDWLGQQEGAIILPWTNAVLHAYGPLQSKENAQNVERWLTELFDGIVVALRTGNTLELDKVIQTLVTDRLGQGYTLADFLHLANTLRERIWAVAETSTPASRALIYLRALDPLFAHSITRLAWHASQSAESQLEEELERTRDNLAKIDGVKLDFINVAAHELKTPLTLVQGYAAILSGELEGQENLQAVLQGLSNGVERLKILIQDMIDVSLIDSNVLALSLHPASLYQVVRLAADDVKAAAVDRDLHVEVQRFPTQVSTLFLDAQRMYQVFSNLIGNAIKYTPDNGTVTISAQVLSDPRYDLRFVETTVADTGIGIDSDDLSHIFEKFYRAGETELHSTSKTRFKGGGPGLGLAIAKGIIEAHGGRIWAESPGYDEHLCPGSTFHVMLPVYTELPENLSERLARMDMDSP
jgi:signal transduction histidine kinase